MARGMQVDLRTTPGQRDAASRRPPARRWRALGPVWRVAMQVALVAGAYGCYRAVRALTESEHGRALHHADVVLGLERRLGIDWEHGLQSIVLDRRWLIDVCNVLYTWLFWPTVFGAMLVLYLADRRRYRVYRNALFVSGAVGLAVFAAFPLAPPRMLAGYVDTIVTFSNQGQLAHPASFTNQYAAMPSFHVGWTVLAGVALMPLVRRRLSRVALVLPGASMAAAVVATANHFVVDGVVGVVIAVSSLVLVNRLCRRSQPTHEMLDDATQRAYPARHCARPGVSPRR